MYPIPKSNHTPDEYLESKKKVKTLQELCAMKLASTRKDLWELQISPVEPLGEFLLEVKWNQQNDNDYALYCSNKIQYATCICHKCYKHYGVDCAQCSNEFSKYDDEPPAGNDYVYGCPIHIHETDDVIDDIEDDPGTGEPVPLDFLDDIDFDD